LQKLIRFFKFSVVQQTMTEPTKALEAIQAENVFLRTEQARIQAEKDRLESDFGKFKAEHLAYSARITMFQLAVKPCFYLVDLTGDGKSNRLKYGVSVDITGRVQTYRTSNPQCKVLFVIYSNYNRTIESICKTRFASNIVQNGGEIINNVPLNDVAKWAISLSDNIGAPYEVENQEMLEKFNSHVTDAVTFVVNKDLLPPGLKRCGGERHNSGPEADRIMPLCDFALNESNKKDGYARLCKECVGSIAHGEDRKRPKPVIKPKFDPSTEKWCGTCKSIKPLQTFYCDNSTGDKLASNCKECKAKMKQEARENKAKNANPNQCKRCTGSGHETEEERMLPLSAFKQHAKNLTYASECEECKGKREKKIKKRPVKNAKDTHEYDKETHKWCKACDTVKLHGEFHSKQAKCKECNKVYRKELKEKKLQTEIEPSIESENSVDSIEQTDKIE